MAKARRRHGPFSKAQVRWMFATHQRFAKKWGERQERRGGVKVLPPRTGVRKRI